VLRRVDWYAIPDVSKDSNILMRHPKIIEDLFLQQHCCEKIKSSIKYMKSRIQQ